MDFTTIDFTDLTRMLTRRFGDDIAQEALCCALTYAHGHIAAYAVEVAQRMHRYGYSDMRSRRGSRRFREQVTQTGELWGASGQWMPGSRPDGSLVAQEAQASAQEQLRQLPQWFVEIHAPYTGEVLSPCGSQMSDQPTEPWLPAPRPRLWAVRQSWHTRRRGGRPRTLVYLHPASVTPGATHRRIQPRVVPVSQDLTPKRSRPSVPGRPKGRPPGKHGPNCMKHLGPLLSREDRVAWWPRLEPHMFDALKESSVGHLAGCPITPRLVTHKRSDRHETSAV